MAFSFSNWFKKPASSSEGDTATATAPEAASASTPRFPAAPPPPAPKAVPPRTIKTVVPNSIRPVSLREGIARPGVNPLTPPTAASLRSGPSTVSPTATRPIAFPSMVPVSPVAAPAPAPQPAAAASAPPAFQAAPGAVVTIPLGEFFDRLPANLLRPGATVDRERAVVLPASDLYSDLARGRASVPVSAVQTACPDLFNRPVSPTEDVEVVLPLQRVIEQLASTFQARPDQVAEEDVTEIETPFLQVALEDSMRLPKPPAPPRPVAAVTPPPAPARNPLAKTGAVAGAEALTIRALTPRQTPAAPHAPAHAPVPPPPNPLAPPTRDSVAPINTSKRPPSTVRASVAGGKIRLSGPAISSRSIAPAAAHSSPAPLAPPAAVPQKPIVANPAPPAAAAASLPAQKKTARIQIPPIALRPGGGTFTPAPAAAPTAAPRPVATPGGAPPRAVSFPEPLVSFRATPGEASGQAGPTPSPLRPLPTPGSGLRTAVGAPPPMMPFAPVTFTPPTPIAPVMPPPAAVPAPAAVEEDDGARIYLTLAPIFRTLPDVMFAHGLDGYTAAEQVPDDAKVELPLGFITSQLAQGRVAVPRAMFVAAMPEACRHLLPTEGEPAEVLIPLQEVFQNLPTGALTRRHDQVVDEVGPEIPTPFSQKAQEDAQRLAPPPAAEPEPEPEPEALDEEPAVIEPEPEPVEALAEPAAPAVVEPEPEPVAVEEPAVEEAEAPAPVAEVLTPTPEETPDEPMPEAVVAPEVTPVADEVPPAEETTPEAVAPEEPVAAVEEPAAVFAEENTEESAVAPATPEAEAEEAPAIAEVEAEPVADQVPETPEAVVADAPVVEEEPSAVVAPEPLPVPVRDLTPTADEVTPDARFSLPTVPSNATNGQHRAAPVASAEPVPASLEEIQDALRAIFMVDDDLDAKKVVRLASSLPGLKACSVMFGDGLKLAGELEGGLSSSEGFCAMTPPFFRRVRGYATELGLGETQCVTLQTERALLSFFMAGDICLSVQHAGVRAFLPGVREKLLAATTELARMYATPVAARR